MTQLTQHRISLPASQEDIAKLKPGCVVFLDGIVYAAFGGVAGNAMAAE
ncbi:MAG: hypothetical protein AAFR79_09260 [Pseudomonadota bacterium]